MSKSRPTNTSQRMPQNVRLSQMKALPSGTANLIRDIANHDPRCRVLVGMAKQTTDARGKMRFSIQSMNPDNNSVRIRTRCDGQEHRMNIYCESLIRTTNLIDFLRKHLALDYDRTCVELSQTVHCVRCGKPVTQRPDSIQTDSSGNVIVARRPLRLCVSCVENAADALREAFPDEPTTIGHIPAEPLKADIPTTDTGEDPEDEVDLTHWIEPEESPTHRAESPPKPVRRHLMRWKRRW